MASMNHKLLEIGNQFNNSNLFALEENDFMLGLTKQANSKL
jgi:hypothetical protein